MKVTHKALKKAGACKEGMDFVYMLLGKNYEIDMVDLHHLLLKHGKVDYADWVTEHFKDAPKIPEGAIKKDELFVGMPVIFYWGDNTKVEDIYEKRGTTYFRIEKGYNGYVSMGNREPEPNKLALGYCGCGEHYLLRQPYSIEHARVGDRVECIKGCSAEIGDVGTLLKPNTDRGWAEIKLDKDGYVGYWDFVSFKLIGRGEEKKETEHPLGIFFDQTKNKFFRVISWNRDVAECCGFTNYYEDSNTNTQRQKLSLDYIGLRFKITSIDKCEHLGIVLDRTVSAWTHESFLDDFDKKSLLNAECIQERIYKCPHCEKKFTI